MSRTATILVSCAVMLIAALGPPATPAAASRYETVVTYETVVEQRGGDMCRVTYRVTTVYRYPDDGVGPPEVVSRTREEIARNCWPLPWWLDPSSGGGGMGIEDKMMMQPEGPPET